MARLRRDNNDVLNLPFQRPLRIVASGTLFLTHTLTLSSHPEPASVVRAHAVQRARGGSASTCLAIAAQFPNVNAILVAPLGGNEEGQMIIRDLENDRLEDAVLSTGHGMEVGTRKTSLRPDKVLTIPSFYVDDTNTKTIINNNPLPDITHEEFVSLLGPLLVPENYAYLNSGTSSNPSSPPPFPNSGSSNPRPSMSSPPGRPPQTSLQIPNNPAPLDWIHFEGRSVKTTLNNLVGLDGLAREKKWRSYCVFSVDVGRKTRQGVEALIPHADVIFLNKHYAMAHSRDYATSPRAFLLSLTHIAPPHALLVAHWGTDGAAVLSVPTREYFQSSGWVEPPRPDSHPTSPNGGHQDLQDDLGSEQDVESVRSGSTFWAGAGHHTESSSEFTVSAVQRFNSLSSSSSDPSSNATPRGNARHKARHRRRDRDDDSSSSDSDGTQIAGQNGRGSNSSAGLNGGNQQNRARPAPDPNGVVDEVGASDAFIAGMMYALTRRMLPGEPYTPSAVQKGRDGNVTGVAGANGTMRGAPGAGAAVDLDMLRGKWRLEECLRFATELAGRKARRKGWDGLAEEMARAGWFDT
ncbi:hypothetical protein EIP91_000175 [Steccherinum ochraceum]|uniref:Carbohydrate kinase PfkB domain-containing protein n=1 Tax=Steccherinum ochraceum TaxID=92696 RepID=A0A4R0RUA2_9APHY|nr:hypothetical protein EIP91_000175 [Steccherinum ochraceum]